MTNILTAAEGANALRCETTDANMLDLLPSVDSYIRTATGHDWTADSPIHPAAKSAARMLLVMWHENPAMLGSQSALNFGLTAALVQLESIALRYNTFEGLNGAGPISLPGARLGDTVSALIGVVGATGSQAASFESVITVDGQIQQTATSDLSGKFYRAYLVPAESIV